MARTLRADPAAMHRHLQTLFGHCPDDGLIELTWDNAPRGKLTRFGRWPVGEMGRAVELAEQKTNAGLRVYMGAALRKPDTEPGRPSKNTDCFCWPAMFWDWDSLAASERGLEVARSIGLPLDMLIQTGSTCEGKADLRLQVWTLIAEGPCFDYGRVQPALKQGIRVLGSDKSVHDARRVMRLAGSIAWAVKEGRQDEPVVFRDDLRWPQVDKAQAGTMVLVGAGT